MNFKEKIFFFSFEALMVLNLCFVGYSAGKGNFFMYFMNALTGCYCYGMCLIYAAKYNIKPFWFCLFPKKIQDYYK